MQSRYVLALVAAFGQVLAYAMRVSFSVIVVTMVKSNYTTRSSEENGTECHNEDDVWMFSNRTVEKQHDTTTGEFEWDEKLQGIIHGSFFWGYLTTQIVGGRLAERCGGKVVVAIGMATAASSSFLSPIAARTHIVFFLMCRALLGIGLGVLTPAINCLLAKWSPPNQRSRLVTMSYSGTNIGVVAGLPLTGLLCESGIIGGWPLAYYFYGCATLVWIFVLYFTVYDSPSSHPRISQKELDYIYKSNVYTTNSDLNDREKKASNMPWKMAFSSKPVWAIVFGYFGFNWGVYTFMTQLPFYMKTMLKMDIKQSSLLSSLPYLLCWSVAVVCSWAADYLVANGKATITNTRRLFSGIALIIPAICLFAISFMKCRPLETYILLTTAVSFFGGAYGGFLVNCIDIAPNYAGTLYGTCNTIAAISGIIAPYMVGVLTEGHQTHSQWSVVFNVTAVILISAYVIYFLLGNSDVQKWNSEKYALKMHFVEELVDLNQAKDLKYLKKLPEN